MKVSFVSRSANTKLYNKIQDIIQKHLFFKIHIDLFDFAISGLRRIGQKIHKYAKDRKNEPVEIGNACVHILRFCNTGGKVSQNYWDNNKNCTEGYGPQIHNK